MTKNETDHTRLFYIFIRSYHPDILKEYQEYVKKIDEEIEYWKIRRKSEK